MTSGGLVSQVDEATPPPQVLYGGACPVGLLDHLVNVRFSSILDVRAERYHPSMDVRAEPYHPSTGAFYLDILWLEV